MLLGSWLADLSATAVALLVVLYLHLTRTHNHWKKKGVRFIKPSIPLGNFNGLLLGKSTLQQIFDDIYAELKAFGFGGVYNGREPVLMVFNPELIKCILTKDFNTFHDRGIPYNEKSDPFSANLVNLSGQRWKILRSKLSPTFTSGRIKGMFPLIQKCTQQLKEHMHEMIKQDPSVELRDLLVRFTTDVIGSCAFGINCNSIQNPKAEFHTMARDIFDKSSNIASVLRTVLTIALAVFPKLQKLLTTKRMFSKSTSFFMELMDRTVNFRKQNKVQRNDFVDLMMKIMEEDCGELRFNQDLMTSQAFTFFLAGLDNVAMNIGFCLHALAVDPDLQERVHHEISTVLEEYNQEMCYEALNKMELVSRVLDEGLRKYTPAGVLLRKQTEEKYVIPGTDIELEKGTSIMVPTQCLHMDEEYFPNPHKFDPGRFTDTEKAKRRAYTYLPFGEGPRFCIATRFANLEMRHCLAELVREFHFSVGPKTDILMELDPKSFSPAPKHNFWLKVTPR